MKYCINKIVNQVWFKWNPLCKCLIYSVRFIKFSFTILIKELKRFSLIKMSVSSKCIKSMLYIQELSLFEYTLLLIFLRLSLLSPPVC